jgi:hypothetical protein
MGIQTTEEVVEMGPEGNGQPSRPIFAGGALKPRFEPKSRPMAEPKDEVPMNSPQDAVPEAHKLSESAAPKSAASLAPDAPPTPATALRLHNGQYNYLKALIGLIGLSKHSEADVLTFLRNTRKCDESLVTLAQIADSQPSAIVWTHDSWTAVDREIARLEKYQVI